MKDYKTIGTAVLLVIGAFVFYLATLAPTVLWGDDAFFQWSAAAGYLQPDGGGHWLHFVLARQFVQLPFGDPAFRVNLLSAVSGSLTLLFIFASGKALDLSNSAALAGALSLAVSHTFWAHAVRAEVYTVFTMLLGLILWLLIRWRQERPLSLYTAAFLFGPAILSHQMILFLLPTFTLFLWLHRDWLTIKTWILALFAFTVGLLLALWLIQIQVSGETIIKSLVTYFTQSETDFSGALFGFSRPQLAADIGFWLAMLGLQFVGPAVLLALVGLTKWSTRSKVLIPLIIFYITSVLFAISYRVNDRFVFFLPGYLVVALLVGLGWQAFREKRPSLALYTVPALIIIPILTYAILPTLLQTADFPLPTVRELPGREPLTYFLWPAKNDYRGASDFGLTALNDLPQNSILLADHTPFETLNYLQQIAGVRPDVLLVRLKSGQDIRLLLETFEKNRPIFLADNNPAYYNVSSIPGAVLIPEGLVYKLDSE